MNKNYLNVYNNLIKFSRNKNLFKIFTNDDSFSDRLIMFLFHFGFFLKIYKTHQNKQELQKIYDYVFRQIELSIREIGYGDASVNERMKTYITTLCHSEFNDKRKKLNHSDSIYKNKYGLDTIKP